MNINLYNLYTKYPRWNLQYENAFEELDSSLINQLNTHFDDIYNAYLTLMPNENDKFRVRVVIDYLFGYQIIIDSTMLPYSTPNLHFASDNGSRQFELNRIIFSLDWKDNTTIKQCSYSFFSYGLFYVSKVLPIEKLAEDMLMYQQYLDNLTKLRIAFNNQYKRLKNFFA